MYAVCIYAVSISAIGHVDVGTSDHGGRYRYKIQPAIAQWNLAALCSVFRDIVPVPALEDIVAAFKTNTQQHIDEAFKAKLGLGKQRWRAVVWLSRVRSV